ncbi:MAG: SUMF1/EgtB/PvdO family nonheme iron enzyme [Planctomycetes bacterium]|nr:SUMF1/EgtB/PvdO family nonheme iron enzyme [Planctomycetota bacterium]
MQFFTGIGEQTGKTYRLPTEQEWEHVYYLGEGDLNQPPTDEEAQRHSVYTANSWADDIEDWATKPVGSTEPNALGIYDLAGNVCEWVTETGEQRVARGGHFDSDREELGVGRHIEVPDWNRDYPNEPKSIWWFVNARWVGFRVVREVPGR